MSKRKKYVSPIIGFCKCAKCGWGGGKYFNWHTYFKCPECGSKEYIHCGLKEIDEEIERGIYEQSTEDRESEA